MVSRNLLYDIIDFLLTAYSDLSKSASAVLDVLSYEVFDTSLGVVLFGVGFYVYITYLVARWLISPT